MSHNDTISDFLTRVRNASKAGHRHVDVRWSSIVENVAEVMKSERFIDHFITKEDGNIKKMRVFLRYTSQGKPVINDLKRVSSPGCRNYKGFEEIPEIFNGFGISILSTSLGVMAGKVARKKHVGGELLCYIW
jgi:small subunit ribosomal protein S8